MCFFFLEKLHSKDISLIHNEKTPVKDNTWIMKIPDIQKIPEIHVVDKPEDTDANLQWFLEENDLVTVGPKLDQMDYKEPRDLEHLSRKKLRLVQCLIVSNWVDLSNYFFL